MNPPQTKLWRILRRCLVGIAICATLYGLYYTEELWRGKRAWEKCKSALIARGVDLNWAHHIPPPVPENENVLGVPEMQKWFVGRGNTELSTKLRYPGKGTNPNARLTIANVVVRLTAGDASGFGGATALQWEDPRAREMAARMITDAVGPVMMAPGQFDILARQRADIRPAQIIMQCKTEPSENELLRFFSGPGAFISTTRPLKVEPAGNGSWRVTMDEPATAAEFLKWSDQFEPEFSLIHQALQRPSIRLEGNYEISTDIPIPNFVTIRNLAQTLGARAQCHLLLGQPDAAVRDLALIRESCRITEESRPLTLVAAMINVAVTGLEAGVIDDGFRIQAWREPQLVALETQLKQVNILQPLRQSYENFPMYTCRLLETAGNPPRGMLQNLSQGSKLEQWILARMFVRGWLYQNYAACLSSYSDAVGGLDPARQIVLPDTYARQAKVISAHWSPYVFIAREFIPNYRKATQTAAYDQTLVNEALTACALERHRLARGQYPEALDALVPEFIDQLPHDIIGGQPLHYSRESAGTFILYSIGWNATDDGGARNNDTAKGDWVWPIAGQ